MAITDAFQEDKDGQTHGENTEFPGERNGVEIVRHDIETVTVRLLPIDAPYECLEETIPEVAAMKGYDQRSEFHSLTLDDHTREMIRHLGENPFVAQHPKHNLIVLAGKLHDIGKMSPKGQQVHPKDSEKRQYSGHEKESQRMAGEVLSLHFELSVEDRNFVTELVGLHASALSLVNNFSTNNSPKGKDLKAYDDFIARVEAVLGAKEDLEEMMRIIFAINRSDKMAGFNAKSNFSDPKVRAIKEKSDGQVATLDQMEKALPALLKAIRKRRGGDKTAGIVKVGDEYFYNKEVPANKSVPEKKPIPDVLKPLGRVLRNKLQTVADHFDDLVARKDNSEAFDNALKDLGLTDEQAEAVREILK